VAYSSPANFYIGKMEVSKIRLSRGVESCLEACAAAEGTPTSEYWKPARQDLGTITVDRFWEMLVENNQYSRFTNFTGGPIGNEDDVKTQIVGMSPAVVRELQLLYVTNGYLERQDVIDAFGIGE